MKLNIELIAALHLFSLYGTRTIGTDPVVVL